MVLAELTFQRTISFISSVLYRKNLQKFLVQVVDCIISVVN